MEQILEEDYKKETDGKSYLLLRKTKRSYEEAMIREAMPAGVLPIVKSEQENRYKYDITGRKTLSMTFERVPMNAEQVQKVLQGIFSIVERAREYLLSEEHFILRPDYIFLRIPEYEVTLCYYPEYGVSFSEQLGKLFEMLLNRVDYREEKAIALVYTLYMQLQEPDMTLERLKEKLSGYIGEEIKGISGSVRMEAFVKAEGAEQVEEESRKKTSFLERLREEVSLKRPMQAEERRPRSAAGKKSFFLVGKKQPERIQQPAYVMESSPEWGSQHTRVISVKREDKMPFLVSEETGESIPLAKFPFYIGSLAGYADYVISSDTVSRFHAKLLKKDGDLFVVDLNSTNGTKVNGQLLNLQEAVRLLPGDRISFADRKYRYLAEAEERDSLFYR